MEVVIDILNGLVLTLLTNCRFPLYLLYGICLFVAVMFSSDRESNLMNHLLLKHHRQEVHHLPSLVMHQSLQRMKSLRRLRQLVKKCHNVV